MHLTVYSRRWGHTDNYQVEITDKGWAVSSNSPQDKQCDSTGQPGLFYFLNHDNINYPESLGQFMHYLWKHAKENSWGDAEIQEQLDALGEWIQITEKATPRGMWEPYI